MTVKELKSVLENLPDDEVLWMVAREDGYAVQLVSYRTGKIIWEDA